MEPGVSAPGLAPAGPLETLDDERLAEWRASLDAAGYRPGVISACESLLPLPVEAVRRPLIHWMLERRGDPAALLARLWSYDDAVEAGAHERLAGPRLHAALLESGALVRRDDRVRAAFRLMPFEDLWILSDRPDAGPDAVMGPGGTTGEVARLLPPRLAGEVLDLGCGAGSLALVAARRGARRVTGTDVNPRAVAVARVNARLNGIANAGFAAGDLFAPVEERRFDRVVSQPPYVICPPGTAPVTFLHGGPAGDTISARLLREVPAHLVDGGAALVIMDVPLGDGVPLERKIREMIGDDAADLCLIAATGLRPATQAAVYAMLEDPALSDRYAAAARRYRQHLEERAIQDFRHVAVVMRRGTGGPGITALLPVAQMPRGAGRDVDEVMAGLVLASAVEEQVLASAVTASPWASFVQERRSPALEEEPTYRVRFQPGAVAVDQELSAASLLLLETLGRAATVAEGAAAYATAIEEAPDSMGAPVLEFVRRGLATGLIVPRGTGAER